MPSGSKYWRLKYRFIGKEKRLALGVYPEVTLKDARDKRDEARKLLSLDIDPSQAKKEQKLELLVQHENNFEAIAREWHESRKLNWTERHAMYVLRRLEADIFPLLGESSVSDITAAELLTVEKRLLYFM